MLRREVQVQIDCSVRFKTKSVQLVNVSGRQDSKRMTVSVNHSLSTTALYRLQSIAAGLLGATSRPGYSPRQLLHGSRGKATEKLNRDNFIAQVI